MMWEANESADVIYVSLVRTRVENRKQSKEIYPPRHRGFAAVSACPARHAMAGMCSFDRRGRRRRSLEE